jgi:hypothetical protein
MATRKRNSEDHSQVKALNPKNPDTKYMGEEPLYVIQPESDSRISSLSAGFSWYNWFYGKKDAKELMCQFLDFTGRVQEAKTMRKVADGEFVNTYCWLARMKLRGLETTVDEETKLEEEITRLLKTHTAPEFKEASATGGAKKEVVVVEAARPNIQEILRDKAKDAAGELEGVFDEFITEGKTKTKTMDLVARCNVMPQHIGLISDVWKKKQAEFTELQEGKDKQLVEGYSHLTKIQVRNTLKFIDQVLTDLNAYISVKKASKAPRQRKAVPVEKIVAKLKYLKTFKDTAAKLDLVSISPVKLHGASEAWVYDTAKRKLHHYLADEYSKSFTVKGNTLLGFDTAKSEVKTLRKPGEQIKEIMGSKPAARKYFTDIKAVATTPNGRFNEAMILLKAF